ncbi:vacuolar protein sorting-associated protein 11 homolog [Drosophila gunungcola]|uniref:vacuolar protein sorting-associated protein 11 homolog n=1 Tax=Drosophila gunungcola TaxID=103775 RepID=UPI0022DEDDF8|nr:vacuolar protein sorting-associated protein 11 homolog [Drosophila gunungcola]
METSVLEWKKVDLFHITALPSVKCLNTSEISCYCFNKSKSTTDDIKIRIVICDQNKNIHIYFSSWECITFKSQPARNTIRLCSLTSNNLLATATQDTNYGIHIDLYDLRRLTKKQGAPIIASAYMQVASAASCIDAEVVDEKLLALAIGFESGDILLHYGKISRLFSANIRQHFVSGCPINGVHFDIKAKQMDILTKIIFVICSQGVYCFVLKDKSCMDKQFVLDNDNDSKYINHCCTIRKAGDEDFEESMLAVGREDAVYCYTNDGRGPCFAIRGTKKCLAWVGHYLVVAVNPIKSNSNQSISTLFVVDTENKMIVFQKQFQDLFCIICEKGFCYIISNTVHENTCNAFILEEHNMRNKIHLLIEKNMYDIALRFLNREGCISSPETALVRFHYGNYLLLKGDISRAVQEFIKTIGFVKPYAVISKLLYSRYNCYLIDYLSEWGKYDKSSKHQAKLMECCINRKQIQHKMQKIRDRLEPLSTTSPLDLKNLSDLSKMYFECTLQNQDKVEDLLQRFLEYGSETLIVDPTTYLENINSENVKKFKNILSFFSILKDYNDYCSKMLAKIIETFPACDEKLYFYLLILYLALWRGNKVSTCFVLNFLKKERLRLDKVLIICRLFSFLSGIKAIPNNQQNAEVFQYETVNKCIDTLIKNNPEVGLDLNISKNSFLMILKSMCSNDQIKVLKIKPVFKEQNMRRVLDSSNEQQLVANLNDKIKRSGCVLALYTNNPIEFRNDKCNICHETLNMQTIYFLCQHSFHKDCLNYNSAKRHDQLICVVCETKKQMSDSKNRNKFNLDSSNIIAAIANVVGLGVMKLGTESMIEK